MNILSSDALATDFLITMATINLTKEEKIELFKMQCRDLEHNAEMLVGENYDIEPVIKMSKYGNRDIRSTS